MAKKERNIDGAFSTSLTTTSSKSQDINTLVKILGPRNTSLSSQVSILGIDLASALSKTENEERGSNSDGYDGTSEFIDTAGSVAQKYIQEKIDRIVSAYKTKVDITIGALVGEVSPYVVNTKEAFSLLGDKIDDLIRYMAGVNGTGGETLKDLIDDLGTDVLEYMANDPAMMQATSSLNVVKAFGQVLNTYAKVESIVSKVLSTIEPLIPALQIFTNIVLSFYSGGASATEAGQESAELVEHYCQELLAWGMGVLKKYLFSIKVKLPAIVVGALNSISVREAMLTVDYKSDWLRAIFDEDFYEQTMYSAQWQDAINTAINTTLGSYADLAKNTLNFNFTNSNGDPITRGDFMKSKFMSTLTSTFMTAARMSARKTAFIYNIDWDQDKSTLESSESSEYDSDTEKENGSALDKILNRSYAEMVSIKDLKTIRNLSSKLIGNY